MKKILFTILLLLLATPAYADTFNAVSVGDTFYGTAYSTGPNGDRAYMSVGGWGDAYYSFVKFDLTGSPTSVTSAILYVAATSSPAFSPQPRVYRLTSDWDEATMTKTSGVPSLDSSTYASSTSWTNAVGWKQVDITTLYQQWINGTYANYGVTIVPTYTTNSDQKLSTREDGIYAPYILVTGTTPTPNATSSNQIKSSMIIKGNVVFK